MKRRKIHNIAAVAAAAMFATIFAGDPAVAQSVEEFYQDRSIELVIGYSAGGGYDRYGRLLARHMGRHIPGNPTVIPMNMPGAGSLVAANHLYAVAPADGTVMGIFSRGLPTAPLLTGDEGIGFEATKFSWIGSLNREVSICVSWHTAAVKTWPDILSTELVTAGSGAADDTAVINALRGIFGARLRTITGYPGSSEMLLAMERGEVDGFCGWSWSSAKSRRPEWFRDGKVNILLQMALEKHPDMPDIPLVMDLAETDQQKQMLTLIFGRQTMGRPFAAPPGVPEERVRALRDAFEATLRDPVFLADAEQTKLEINPVSGEAIDALLQMVYRTPEDIVAATREAIQN